MSTVTVTIPTEPFSGETADILVIPTTNETETGLAPEFRDSSTTHSIIWPSLLIFLIITANSLTLAAFCVEEKLRTYNNYFIINLSILDLLVGLAIIVTVIHTHTGYYPLNESFCKVLGGITYSITNASNFTMVIICLDRHRATYDPINHFVTRSKRKAVLLNSLPCLISFTLWMLYITAWEFIDDFDNGPGCVRHYTSIPGAYVIYSLVMFYLPLILISVLYFRIVIKIQSTRGGQNVKRMDNRDNDNSKKNTKLAPEIQDEKTLTTSLELESEEGERVEEDLPQEAKKQRRTANKLKVKTESATEMRKATRTLLFIVLSFMIAWLPQCIIQLVYSINPVLVVRVLPRSVWLIFSWMIFGNSLLNPISYAITQPLLRTKLRKMICCSFCKDT